jgi:NAD(P)H-hydrate epimerase
VDSFTSEAGLVVPAVTAAQMREVDRVATAEVGPNLYQMMENAGQALAAFCMVTLGDKWTAAPVVVVVGTGGNGGGGMCAARHLANHGGDVTLVPSGAERLAGVPAEQLALYRAAGGRCVEPRSLEALQPALVVDALLGYNLTGEPYGVATDLIGWMADADAPVVSLDVPSGLNATTGDCPGAHVRAATTMTLALPKTGLHVDEVGELCLADIGIPRGVLERAGVRTPPTKLFSPGYRVRLTTAADPRPVGPALAPPWSASGPCHNRPSLLRPGHPRGRQPGRQRVTGHGGA